MDTTPCARDLCVVCGSFTYWINCLVEPRNASWPSDVPHVEVVIRAAGVSNNTFTPYVSEQVDTDTDELPIDAHHVTVYRSAAMRAASVAQDSLDLQCSIREIAQDLHSVLDKFADPREIS